MNIKSLLPRIVLMLALAAATLDAQRAQIPQHLVFTPHHASGIYEVGETVGWTITSTPTAPAYKYRWTIRRHNAVVLKEGTLDLSSGKASIEVVADQPAMLYVAIEAYGEEAPQIASPSATADGSRFV